MKTQEPLINTASEYQIHNPSTFAKEHLYYPLISGHYIYEPGYNLKRENFTSYLVMVITSGELNVYSKNDAYHSCEGDVILIDCQYPHGYSSDTGFSASWIHFDGHDCDSLFDSPLKNSNVFIYKRHIREALSAIQNIEIGQNEALSSAILYELIMHLISEDTESNISTSNPMAYCGQFLCQHFSEHICMDDLAKMINLSKYHFIRQFKKYYGVSPYQYTISLRLDNAKYLLKTSSLTIKEIAYLSGFPDESSFCNTFKSRTGVTPIFYRIN